VCLGILKRREERINNEGGNPEDTVDKDSRNRGTRNRGDRGGTQDMERWGIYEILQGDEN
jgi:hypothetical protein